MTATTLPDALAIESARGAEHLAQIRAEGWRAGYAAGLEAAAKLARAAFPEPEDRVLAHDIDLDTACAAGVIANRIRSLAIPETPNG